jgi:rare lipoprotein A (peptidoglycan hydrolase)
MEKRHRVTIVDRGIQSSAIIDLSAEAFKQLATLGTGKISVTLEKP